MTRGSSCDVSAGLAFAYAEPTLPHLDASGWVFFQNELRSLLLRDTNVALVPRGIWPFDWRGKTPLAPAPAALPARLCSHRRIFPHR
jgi:hypothetical protein